MFLSRNKKNIVYPCKPQFYYIKVGFKGSEFYRYVFVMQRKCNLCLKQKKRNVFPFIPRHKIVVGHVGCLCPSICLSYVHPSVFSFPDNNLNNYQWISILKNFNAQWGN